MIKLNKPNHAYDKVFDSCVHNISDKNKYNRIVASKKYLIDASNEYDALAGSGKLFTIKEHSIFNKITTKDDMVWLYDSKYVKDGGRVYYDIIKSIPPFGICPLCGQRKVSTLDHYLPKTKYPTYSITAYNLIAACYECNKIKLATSFKARENETIHPYYDNFDDAIWIKARIIEGEPVGFYYYVEKPTEWPKEKCERAKSHFSIYQLNELFASHAANEFNNNLQFYIDNYKVGGEEKLKEHINECLLSRERVRLNSWENAMLRALYNSKWFFNNYLKKYICE